MAQYRFGKLPARNSSKTWLFDDYGAPGLPPPPLRSCNLSRVYTALGTSDPTELFPMDGNDTVGCCTIAGLAHLLTIFNAFLGRKVIPSTADVLKLYYQLTGGPDTGLDLMTVMNYCRQNSFLGEKPILAYAKLDPHNLIHVQYGVYWFGGLYSGMQVQANAIKEFDARKPWTPGKLLNEGHCIVTADYTATEETVLTWGNTELATWPWEKKCVDELYAISPQEAQEPCYCPGFDLVQLQKDLALVTQQPRRGNVEWM